jgi:hypothetical protein
MKKIADIAIYTIIAQAILAIGSLSSWIHTDLGKVQPLNISWLPCLIGVCTAFGAWMLEKHRAEKQDRPNRVSDALAFLLLGTFTPLVLALPLLAAFSISQLTIGDPRFFAMLSFLRPSTFVREMLFPALVSAFFVHAVIISPCMTLKWRKPTLSALRLFAI